MKDEDKEKQQKSGFNSSRLLERKAEQDYIDDWTNLLAKPIPYPQNFKYSPLVIFRIYDEWLALCTQVFVEIGEKRPLHTIPHRSNKILLGLINLRGQLRLCIALHNFLEIKPREGYEDILKNYQRILAIQKDGEFWAIPVHEVFGIYYCTPDSILNVPVTIAKSTANYLKGVITWEGNNVGYLDEELLFYSLRKGF